MQRASANALQKFETSPYLQRLPERNSVNKGAGRFVVGSLRAITSTRLPRAAPVP